MADPVKALETLRGMRELLASPDSWTRGADARNALGVSDDDYNHEIEPAFVPVCWCISGAAMQVSGLRDGGVFTYLAETLSVGDSTAVVDWNDAEGRTHADVLGLLDSTIARLEASNA